MHSNRAVGKLTRCQTIAGCKRLQVLAGKPAKLHVERVDFWTALAERSGDSAFDMRMVCTGGDALRLPPQYKIVLI
jgi:hypothetical protein